MNNSPHQRIKGSRWEGRTGRDNFVKTQPLVCQHTAGRDPTDRCLSEGPHPSHQPWDLHWRDEPPEQDEPWKNQQHGHPRAPKCYRKLRFPSWRAHLQSFRSSEKKAVWKVPELYVREIYLLTWWHRLEGWGQLRCSLEMEALAIALL